MKKALLLSITFLVLLAGNAFADIGTVANIRIINTGTTTIELGWDPMPNPGNIRNIVIINYEVYINGSKLLVTSSSNVIIDKLVPNTSYSFTVTALDPLGAITAASSSLTARTLIDTDAPTAPDHLAVTNVSGNSIGFSWDISTDNVGVVEYEVYVNGIKKQKTSLPTYTVTNLVSNTVYSLTVKAVDDAGNISALSSILTAKTVGDAIAPTIPLNLRSGKITLNSIALSWDRSTDSVGVKNYEIYMNGIKKDSTNAPGYIAKNLTSGTLYSFFVKAADDAGNVSASSNVLGVKTLTPDTTAPSKPINLKLVKINDTSLIIQWDTSTDNVGVSGYDIYVNGVKKDSSVSPSSIITSLNLSTTYSLTVKASDEAGNKSPSSNTVSGKTLGDIRAPTIPQNLKALYTTRSSVELSWDLSTDNVGVTQYNVYVNGKIKSTTTTPSYIVKGLNAKTAYTFTVSAGDLIKNTSAVSNPVTASTNLMGFKYKHYQGMWTSLPDDFNILVPVKNGTCANLDLEDRKSGVDENYGFLWEGFIKINTPGTYTFGTIASGENKLFFNTLYSPSAKSLLHNDGLSNTKLVSANIVVTAAGVYPITIAFLHKKGKGKMVLYMTGPSLDWQLMSNDAVSDITALVAPIVGTSNTVATGIIGANFVPRTSAAMFQDVKVIKAYPSPFIDRLQMDFNNGTTNSKVSVEVADQSGRIVYTHFFGDVASGNQTLGINLGERKLNPGMYLVTLKANGIAFKTLTVMKGSN